MWIPLALNFCTWSWIRLFFMARLLSMCHVPADVAPGMPGSGVPAPACLGLNNARHSQATCLGDMAVVEDTGNWAPLSLCSF